jgi:hypothetical protein
LPLAINLHLFSEMRMDAAGATIRPIANVVNRLVTPIDHYEIKPNAAPAASDLEAAAREPQADGPVTGNGLREAGWEQSISGQGIVGTQVIHIATKDAPIAIATSTSINVTGLLKRTTVTVFDQVEPQADCTSSPNSVWGRIAPKLRFVSRLETFQPTL